MQFKVIATAGAAMLAASLGLTGPASAQTKTLTIASFGGKIDDTYRKAMEGFEQKFGVTLRWVPGTTTENAAKIIATKGKPEFDVAMIDDVAQVQASKAGGVISKIDTSIVTNFADLRPQARFPAMDAVPIGFNFTGIFYNEPEFKKRGWAVPQSWNDLFRPEFCKNIGIPHPNVSYTINLVVLLAGGDLAKASDGIAKLAKLKGCVATLEASSAKLEEKIQLGEYLVGLHGSVRVLPLATSGYPVRFVIPKEGSTLSSTTIAVVTGGNEKLAQEFVNWMISPPAQKVLMEEGFFLPSNSKVEVPAKLLELGMPGPDVLKTAVDFDREAVITKRRDWARQIERELTP